MSQSNDSGPDHPDEAQRVKMGRESLVRGAVDRERKRFWRANLTLTFGLLAIWFLLGPLAGIVFVEQLNQFKLGGFPLGFWFAQQGSIIGFILILLVYAIWMGRLDAVHRRRLEALGVGESSDASSAGGAA
jgi:putative solute:sodium symporter small subunit